MPIAEIATAVLLVGWTLRMTWILTSGTQPVPVAAAPSGRLADPSRLS